MPDKVATIEAIENRFFSMVHPFNLGENHLERKQDERIKAFKDFRVFNFHVQHWRIRLIRFFNQYIMRRLECKRFLLPVVQSLHDESYFLPSELMQVQLSRKVLLEQAGRAIKKTPNLCFGSGGRLRFLHAGKIKIRQYHFSTNSTIRQSPSNRWIVAPEKILPILLSLIIQNSGLNNYRSYTLYIQV